MKNFKLREYGECVNARDACIKACLYLCTASIMSVLFQSKLINVEIL